MTDATGEALSETLREISGQLRRIDQSLKSGVAPELLSLQDFRLVLDNARMTAWTVNELLNAAHLQKDPETVLSFVAAERLRRSNQMLKDLCADIENEEVTWQTNGIQALFETVNFLQVQLGKLVTEHRGRFGKVREAGR
jgi:hypothetical protein